MVRSTPTPGRVALAIVCALAAACSVQGFRVLEKTSSRRFYDKCKTNKDCREGAPICHFGACQDKRVVESVDTMPAPQWAKVSKNKNFSKWVRSVFPIVGHAKTPDHALFEVAYMMERVFVRPDGSFNGKKNWVEFMIWDGFYIEVFPHCIAGGYKNKAAVSASFVLQYPACKKTKQCQLATQCYTLRRESSCAAMNFGAQECNECGEGKCKSTALHEIGHGITYMMWQFDPSTAQYWINTYRHRGNCREFPAWHTEYILQRPAGSPMPKGKGGLPYKWMVDIMGFRPDQPGYVGRKERCPEQTDMTKTCDDALTRTKRLPLDLADPWAKYSALLPKFKQAAARPDWKEEYNCLK